MIYCSANTGLSTSRTSFKQYKRSVVFQQTCGHAVSRFRWNTNSVIVLISLINPFPFPLEINAWNAHLSNTVIMLHVRGMISSIASTPFLHVVKTFSVGVWNFNVCTAKLQSFLPFGLKFTLPAYLKGFRACWWLSAMASAGNEQGRNFKCVVSLSTELRNQVIDLARLEVLLSKHLSLIGQQNLSE